MRCSKSEVDVLFSKTKEKRRIYAYHIVMALVNSLNGEGKKKTGHASQVYSRIGEDDEGLDVIRIRIVNPETV